MHRTVYAAWGLLLANVAMAPYAAAFSVVQIPMCLYVLGMRVHGRARESKHLGARECTEETPQKTPSPCSSRPDVNNLFRPQLACGSLGHEVTVRFTLMRVI
jgi:hypothetical protein